MKKLAVLFLAILLLFTGCGPLNNSSTSSSDSTGIDYTSEKLVIAENGATNYRIIVSKAANECEQFAAEELQSFIKQSTETTLPILTDDQVKFSKYSSFISIGETHLYETADFKVDDSELKLDGFVIKTLGNQIFIRGARDRGTLFGVYEFLERFIGVRFFTPEDTKVPKMNTLAVHSMNLIEIPTINVRSYYSVEVDRDALYTARMRMVSLYGNDQEKYGGGKYRDMHVSAHNMGWYIDKDAYIKEYPHFFFEGAGTWDICMSYGMTEEGLPDPNVEISPYTIVLENLKKRVADNPEISYFSVCHNDIPEGCPCDICRERQSQEKGGETGILLRFINALDNELQNWLKENYPERTPVKLVTFAYARTLQPPVNAKGKWLVEPNDNVVIWIAQEHNLAYSLIDERQAQTVREVNEQWVEKAKGIMYWDYRNCWPEEWFYLPGLTTLQPDIQWLSTVNAEYVFFQASLGDGNDPVTWMQTLKTYIAAKLMWNPDINVQELIDEYLEYVYGDSNQVVKGVINLFEDNFERYRQDESVRGSFGSSHHSLYGVLTSQWYPRRMLEASIELLEEEMKRVEHSNMTYEEKERRINLLTNVICTPQRMLLRNYNSYYKNDYDGEVALAKEFLANVQRTNPTARIGSSISISTVKEKYGL